MPCTAVRHPRRIWLAVLALAALLAALSAVARAAEDATLRPRLVLWHYREGTAFQEPRGLAFDPVDGALYVCNTGLHRIEVFSKNGRVLTQFVHRVPRDGNMVDGSPCAIAFDRNGRLLVADLASHSVDVLDRRGRALFHLPATVGQPNAIAVGADGAIYVGTTGEESKIHRFRADYTADTSWGEEGSAPGRLLGLNAVWVMPDGSVAVACARTDLVVQIFSPSGQYLRGFGSHDVGVGSFSYPSGLVATADGRIWVVDEIRQSLQVFDEQGNLITQSDQAGAGPGEFAHPSSLTYDGRGLIAWTDRELGRVQVFEISGL